MTTKQTDLRNWFKTKSAGEWWRSTFFVVVLLFSIIQIQPFYSQTPFKPSDLSGLQLWLSSDTGIVLNGGSVQQWNDISGNNTSAIQNTSSNQPQFISNAINNKPSLRFGKNGNGGDETFLSFPQLNLSSGNFTLFCFCKTNAVTNAIHFILGGNGQGVSSGGSSFPGLVIFDGTNLLQSTSSYNSYGLNGFTSNKIYRNSAQLSTSGSPVSNIALNTIGTRPDFLSGFFYGDIFEVLIFNSQLPDSSRISVENYLYNKYAPPINLGLDTTVCSFPIKLKTKKDYFTNYLWQDSSTDDSLVINASGTYYLTTTDIFGRTSSDTIIITQDNTTYNVNLGADKVICSGNQVTLNAGPSHYTYSWSDGSTNNTNTINTSGTFIVSVTDCNSNLSKDTIIVSVNPLPSFSLGSDTIGCYNSQLILKPNLPILSSYSFLWSNSTVDSILNVTSSGQYWLTATDIAGCNYSDTIQVVIDSILFPVSLGSNLSLCSGNFIYLTSGAGLASSYIWSDGSTNDSLQINNSAGNYSFWLTVTDINNCSVTDSIDVSVLGYAPTANFSANEVCQGSIAQFTDLSTAPLGDIITSWLWDFGDSNTSNSQNPTHTYMASGNYSTKLIVTTNTGCSQQINSTLAIHPTPTADYSYTSVSNSLSYLLYENSAANGISIINRVWHENGNLLSFASSFNKTFSSVGNYNISLIVTNSKGCIDSISKTITVSISPPINNLPTTIPGLKVWLRSDSNLVINSNSVSSWSDISGNGFVFNSQSPSTNPAYVATNFNIKDKPSLVFDGVDDGMKSTTPIALGNLGVTVYVVSKTPVFKPFGVSVAYGTSQAGSWNLIQRGTSARITLINGATNQGAGVNNATSSDLTAKDFTILQGSLNDATDLWQVGENSFIKDSVVSAFTQANSNIMTIGYRDDALGFCNTEIAEIIIFDQELNSSDNAQVIQYLRTRYTSPIDIGPPINKVCDSSITLSVSAGYHSNVLWSNGSTNNSITITQADTIRLAADDVFEFTAKDTIILQSFQTPFSFYSLPDTISCGTNIIWNPGLNPTQHYYLWSDGSILPSITISNSNNYSVIISDTNGCAINSPIIQAIIDDFKNNVSLGSDTMLCSGNTITLINGNQAGINYLWNDNSTNSSLVINTSGEYYLTATNANNCVAKDTINVTIIGQAPIAGFQNTFTCENTGVNFSDTSLALGGATITNWFWNFGDASATNDTAIVAQPNYTYSDTGSYTINLTVTTNAGCKQNLTKNIYIYPKPIVDFINVIACQNDSAFFNDVINLLGYPITNFQWSFGDSGSGANNTSTNSDPYHIFSQNISYQVQLIATNSQGCVDTAIKTITVKDEVSADFNYSTACINVPISFTDNSIAPLPNTTSIRNWSFFPGTATGLSATKTFTSSGSHPVTLTVNGSNGCISSITKSIFVSLPPVADFTSSTICIADSFQLTDASLPINGNINSWQWEFAGSTFSIAQNPKYLLNSSGNASVFLKVTNDSGCVNSITKIIFVNPLPDASFDISPSTYLFIDSPLSFTPNHASASNYFWSLSNGNTFSNPILTLSFTNEDTYTLGLLLTDNFGCKNNSSQTFTIARRMTDLGIIAARSTIDNDGFVGVEADLFNYGSTPITEFEILYELTGGGIMKETWAADTLPPGAVLLFKFSAKSFLSINERENAISCITIQTVNTSIDDNLTNNENCAALNSNKQLVAEPFPNPADGDVSLPIVLTEDQTITITVYDYLGKLIAENITYDGVTGLNFIKIPCAAYSSGTYTLKISISDNNYIRKLIKQGSTK